MNNELLNNLLDEKLKPINDTLEKHTQILRALEHSNQRPKTKVVKSSGPIPFVEFFK